MELVYRADVGDRGLAQGLEHRVKRLTKADKEQLVSSAPDVAELLRRFGHREEREFASKKTE